MIHLRTAQVTTPARRPADAAGTTFETVEDLIAMMVAEVDGTETETTNAKRADMAMARVTGNESVTEIVNVMTEEVGEIEIMLVLQDVLRLPLQCAG